MRDTAAPTLPLAVFGHNAEGRLPLSYSASLVSLHRAVKRILELAS